VCLESSITEAWLYYCPDSRHWVQTVAAEAVLNDAIMWIPRYIKAVFTSCSWLFRFVYDDNVFLQVGPISLMATAFAVKIFAHR